METTLIAKVRAPKTNGKNAIGTAYPIGRNLVLTARHVVDFNDYNHVRDKEKPISIIWEKIPDSQKPQTPYTVEAHQVDIEFFDDKGVVLDIALIRCETPQQVSIAQNVLTERHPTAHEKWETMGFALLGKEVEQWLKEPAMGEFLPPEKDSPILKLTSEADAKEKEKWKGISGSPVFDVESHSLIAVLTDTPTERENCFIAVSIPYLLSKNLGFRKAVGYQVPKEKNSCGIIMPTSVTSKIKEEDRKSIEDILTKAIDVAGFKVNLQDKSNSVNTIRDLYYSDVVICDISFLDSNVMFELGIRLAFNKPTIIIKDDKTPFPFHIESLKNLKDNIIEYPRILHAPRMKIFESIVSEKIKILFEASNGSKYESFLKSLNLPCPKVQFTLNYVKEQWDMIDKEGARTEMSKTGKKTISDYLAGLTGKDKERKEEISQTLLKYVYVCNRIGAGIYCGAFDRDIIYNIWAPRLFHNYWFKFASFIKEKRVSCEHRDMGSYFDWLALEEFKQFDEKFPLKPENKEMYMHWIGTDEHEKHGDIYPQKKAQLIPDNPMDLLNHS